VQNLSDGRGKIPKPKTDASPTHSSDTFPSPVLLGTETVSVYGSPIRLVMGAPRASQHAPKQPPREVTLRQQQPIIAGMLDQPPARLDQPLLQTRQGPVADAPRQHQSPPQVPEIVRDHAQPQSYLIGPEPVAR
jgi:hypothetical protein